MIKVKLSTPTASRRKKMNEINMKKDMVAEIVPVKLSDKTTLLPSVSAISRRKGKRASSLLSSMDLDEMLDASNIVEMRLKGEKIPIATSSIVQEYVNEVLRLNDSYATKLLANKMQQELNTQILEKNKRTINSVEAERLYDTLMKEE